MTLVREAQELGRRGFRVHPLKAKDQPYTKYSQTATSDPDAIAVLWQYFPSALIGICTGQGLVVVDDDRGHDEPDPSLPETRIARTANRGWHHYYYCATPVRNSTSKVASGIDIRGEGGYVVAPPSAGYEWAHVPDWRDWSDSAPPGVTALPGVLLAACLRTEPQAGTFEPRSHVPAGERHDYLVRFAGWALANELVEEGNESVVGLHLVVYEHAMQVCEPWAAHEMQDVYRHIREICRWVIARESGAR